MTVRLPGRVRATALRLLRGTTRAIEGPPAGTYLGASGTVAAARDAGLSVEAYVERLWGQEGQTAAIVERMGDVGALESADTVVEIGPGTGRYLARVRERVLPSRYVILETAADWREWLVATYGVEGPDCDGESIPGVDSADLVHAHGVFVATPLLVTAKYLGEIVRISPRWIVFDVYTRSEFDQATLDEWLRSPHRYPVVLDRDWVLGLLSAYDVIAEWTAPYGVGRSRYFVLRHR